jgi:hypothetical protein
MPTSFYNYEIQLMNLASMDPQIAAGGTVYVAAQNGAAKVVIYDVDTQLAIANPLVPVRGKIRFATLATVPAVDLYGVDALGRCFIRRGVQPGGPTGGVTEVFIDDDLEQIMVIPFSKADVTANVEIDTGFDLPNGVVHPNGLHVDVLTAEATRTILVGTLSSESGGDADGLLALLSLATAGNILWAVSGTPTLGALLVQNFATTPAVNVPVPRAITGTNARSVTYTLSASTASAAGFIYIPYVRGNVTP